MFLRDNFGLRFTTVWITLKHDLGVGSLLVLWNQLNYVFGLHTLSKWRGELRNHKKMQTWENDTKHTED